MTSDPKRPELLVSVPSDIEAAAIVTGLSAHGIRALATGGYTAGFRAEAPGLVRVMVEHAELARAREVLAQLQQETRQPDKGPDPDGGSERSKS